MLRPRDHKSRKSESRNPKSETNSNLEFSNDQNAKRRYDLEDRTYAFARDVRAFVKKLPRTICNKEDVKQAVRSSGSVGANYIEANEALGKKDFRMRIRISRKESKETRYWLRLLDTQGQDLDTERDRLVQESTELMRIFGAILRESR